jgi:hypothetical protein
VIEILGSSVAALVATERLMAAGVAVRRTPSGKANGFAGRVLPDGRTVDVGFRNLELSYGEECGVVPPLSDFRPGSQHGHRPWMSLIAGYVTSLITFDPQIERVAVRGQLSAEDPFLSGDPTSVWELLDADETEEAIWQIERVIASGVRGFDTFAEQARENCGVTIFDALIWPLLHKITGWTEVPARQHRKVWLPLWQPRSVLDALRGEPSYRPERPMYFGCGALVEALERATMAARTDAHHWSGTSTLSFDLADVDQSGGAPIGIAVPAVRSVPIGVAWVNDEEPDGVEWLIDGDNPVFRRTWRNDVCCVEYAAGANIDRWAYDMSFEVLDKCEVRVSIGDVQVSDPRAIGYGNLNDQILQGLAAADRLVNR